MGLLMKKLGIYLLTASLLLVGTDVAAQGSLSNQVLRLLSRINTWTALQTYDAPNGGVVLLGRQSVPLTTRTDRLENIGGNLYFNGTVLASAAASGTVTSVALSLPAIFSVSGSPITSSGTLTGSLATQTANYVWAGPTSGGAAAPTFRALVAADIPSLSSTYLTASSTATLTNKSGNISQWTNDSGYVTSSVASLSSLATVGTITSGTWNAGVVAGQYGGTGVANTGKTFTIGGNFTTSGAFTTTLTVTGNTNVTLPTTGTLVNSAVSSLSSLATVGTITSGTWNGTAVGVAYGGTGLASYTTGDIIYASGATTLSKLADVATGNALISGGVGTAPSWGKIVLGTHTSGTLTQAQGGTNKDTSGVTDGQLLIGKTSDNSWNLATLTGTANQVVVTNGAASITLSTPQSIGTSSTPQFARLGLGTGAGATAVLTTTGIFDTGYYDNGNSGAGTVAINWTNGMTQKVTLTGNPTFTFANPISGTYFRLNLIQDGTGSRTVTWPTITWKGGAAPTLTTTAGKTDLCSFFYNGSAYFGDCSLNY